MTSRERARKEGGVGSGGRGGAQAVLITHVQLTIAHFPGLGEVWTDTVYNKRFFFKNPNAGICISAVLEYIGLLFPTQ